MFLFYVFTFNSYNINIRVETFTYFSVLGGNQALQAKWLDLACSASEVSLSRSLARFLFFLSVMVGFSSYINIITVPMCV